jgi:hypothetical protein
MTEVELLTEIHILIKVIGIFVIARFGWDCWTAFCAGWWRLDSKR